MLDPDTEESSEVVISPLPAPPSEAPPEAPPPEEPLAALEAAAAAAVEGPPEAAPVPQAPVAAPPEDLSSGHGGIAGLAGGPPPGSCPGTTLNPIPPLAAPPGEPRPGARQLFGTLHGIGYLGFCAVRVLRARAWSRSFELLACGGLAPVDHRRRGSAAPEAA